MVSAEKQYMKYAFLALCVSSVGTLSFPLLTGRLMDGFKEGMSDPTAQTEKLVKAVHSDALLCIGALGVAGIFGGLRVYLLENVSERLSRSLRKELFSGTLSRPQKFFDSHRTGELMTRLTSDVHLVSRSVTEAFWGARTGINTLLGSAMVLKTAPLTVVPMLVAPVGGLLLGGLLYGRYVKQLVKKRQEALAKANEHAEEKLSMIKVVKLFNGESRDLAIYNRLLEDVYHVARKLAVASAGQVTFFTLFGGGFMVNLIYNCGTLISEGVLSLGDTSALAMYLMITGKGVQGVVSANAEVQKALGAFERVRGLEAADMNLSEVSLPLNDSAAHPVLFSGGGPTVEFKDVHFAYSEGQKVLEGMTFTVPGESKTAIVGPSGSAKSTIFSLITRLYDKDSGSIQIANRAIEEYTIGELRRSIGVVPQETWLFGGSLMENVAYPEKVVDVMSVTDMAALGFVRDWNKCAGERGQALSGGERQRICIARALVKDPGILLLDEATSALDRETDAVILKRLQEVRRKTVLAVTHKLNIVDWADRLIVVDKGRVVQEGNREHLLGNPGETLRRLLKDIEK